MPIALRLPIPGSDNGSVSANPPTDWGDILNNFLQQTLVNDASGNGNGTLVTAATNPYTGGTNYNLATATYPGLVKLVGDLSNTAASPQVVSTHLSSALPVNQGGTGAVSLAANAVLLGNGTSVLQSTAAGTLGNVLTDNGTTWVSQAPATGASEDFAIAVAIALG